MASVTLIYICFLILLPVTVQHQCVEYCIMFLTFNETFNTLPSTCNKTYQNVECYSDISFNYVSELIEIKFGERSINSSSAKSDDYYVSQETEMWHESFDLQWTVLKHQCYHRDLCDFEYAKKKVFQMRKLTTNFNQFQQKLSSALFTADSGTSTIHCLSTDGQIITCDENIKSCGLHIDNIDANKTHQGCSSQSDDHLRKQLGIIEETSYHLNGKVDVRQSSVEYVCNHELCNGQNAYKNVIQLLTEYNLLDQAVAQTCQGTSQYDQCSSNIACGCLPLVNTANGGTCAYLDVRCSELISCANNNRTCYRPGHLCVKHPRCQSAPLCYPADMTLQVLCPPIPQMTTTSPPVMPDDGIYANAT